MAVVPECALLIWRIDGSEMRYGYHHVGMNGICVWCGRNFREYKPMKSKVSARCSFPVGGKVFYDGFARVQCRFCGMPKPKPNPSTTKASPVHSSAAHQR